MHPSDLEPGQDFGPYTVVRLLGRGGMGAVWLAIQPSLNREVALKVMVPTITDDPEYVARFRREGLTAARLHHPNIVSVFDIGEAEGALYLCLEYVPGDGLNVVLKRDRIVEPARAARWGAQIARALAFAHERGVLHRDIKTSNVLIGPNNDARLMDFGLAKNVDGTALTSTGIMGTPHYMAPELGDGAEASPLSDQYSLGVMLFELVAGRVPYKSETALGVLYMHMEGKPPPIAEFNPGVPGALEDIIGRMMRRTPGDRFANCDGAAEALDAFAAEYAAASAAAPAAARTTVVDRPAQTERLPSADAPGAVSAPPPLPRFLVPVAVVGVVLAAIFAFWGRGGDPVPVAEPATSVRESTVEPAAAPGPATESDTETPATPGPPRAATPPWQEAPFSTLDAHGGFVENFARAHVALRSQTLQGFPGVEKLPGSVRVHGDADTLWRGRSLRAVRVSRCEVVLAVHSTAPDGEAGLYLDAHDGPSFELLVNGAGVVRLLIAAENGRLAEVARLHLPDFTAGAMVRIDVLAGPRGMHLQVNNLVVRSWDAALGNRGYVGIVARGPVDAVFERIVVRPAGA